MKNFNCLKFKVLEILFSVFILIGSPLVINAQNQINLPDCTNCATSTSSAFGSTCPPGYNPSFQFPYKVVDFEEGSDGTFGLITENGKLFIYGVNAVQWTTPYSNYGDGWTAIRSPMRMDLPAGVKATKVSIGYAHGMVLGDDGIVYAWGNASQALAAAPGYNTATLVPMTMPTGLSAGDIIDIAAGDYCTPNSILIDVNGDAWFIGVDYAFSPTLSTWTKMNRPSNNAKYEKIFPTHWGTADCDNEEFAGADFFEADDGNYYAFGSNLYNALGSSAATASGANYIISYNETPVKMGFPAGTVIKDMDAFYALTTDGKYYVWGFVSYAVAGQGFTSFINGGLTGSHIFAEPVEVAGLPSSTQYGLSPTTYLAANRLWAQTDAGLYSWELGPDGTEIGTYTDESIQFKVGICDVFAKIASVPDGDGHSVVGLTTDGRMIGIGRSSRGQLGILSTTVGSHTHLQLSPWNDVARPLIWGVVDPFNPRPSE